MNHFTSGIENNRKKQKDIHNEKTASLKHLLVVVNAVFDPQPLHPAAYFISFRK